MDTEPFRGSEAVRAGRVTWGRLAGPGFRRLGPDTYVPVDPDMPVDSEPALAIRAAVVRAGPGSVVTGWSACVLLGLDVTPGPRPVELAVAGRRMRPVDGQSMSRHRIPEVEILRFDGLRITTPLRTAFDLATRVPLDEAVVAADALGRLGGFDGADLAAFARSHRGARGLRGVGRVATLMDPRSESPMETRTRLTVVLAGIPAPVLQYVVRDGRGHFVARVDMAWPEHRVALEYDGHDHAEDDRRGRDVDRIDALRRAGWVVIVVTWRQYRAPGWVVRRVSEELAVSSGRSS